MLAAIVNRITSPLQPKIKLQLTQRPRHNMNLQEIKDAVNAGLKVHWSNMAYDVICDKNGKWLIKCSLNGYCIGLTWADGKTLNGNESEFFIEE